MHLSISSGSHEEGSTGHNKEQRIIIESLISILPAEKEAVPCQFLLWMLKMAMIYSITPTLLSEIEKRAGVVLQEANVKDLLIPCRNSDQETQLNFTEKCTMYNIDVVQRILDYFLMHEQLREEQQLKFEKISVSKLVDNYLAEISKDPNLTISKFQALAEALPQSARKCHEGLYRAIDTYLKVLFSEQVKMQTAMQGKEHANSDDYEQDENWSGLQQKWP